MASEIITLEQTADMILEELQSIRSIIPLFFLHCKNNNNNNNRSFERRRWLIGLASKHPEFFRWILDHGVFTIRELSQSVFMPSRTLYSLVESLVSWGYVYRHEVSVSYGRAPRSIFYLHGRRNEVEPYLKRLIAEKRGGGSSISLEAAFLNAEAKKLAEDAVAKWSQERSWEHIDRKLLPRSWVFREAKSRGLYPEGWDAVRSAIIQLGWAVLEGR